MNYYLQTFGCQMNHADSEKINMILLQSGMKKVQNPEDAQLILLNTCSVRKKGEDKVLSMARDMKRFHDKNGNPCLIGLTGCMVRKTGVAKRYNHSEQKREAAKQIQLLANSGGIMNSDDKIFGKTEVVDFVFRIEEIPYLTKILSTLKGKEIGNDEKYNEYLKLKQLQENPGSANIVIQTGCDNFCTYCIVPFTRGREKTREMDAILNEIKEAALRGTKEITLIGQNVNSFGKEFKRKLWNEEELKWEKGTKTPFRQLLEEVDKIGGIDRIRFTSSNPHDMTKDILDSHFDLDKTCNYLHFALQSGNNEVLKKMNRKHTYEDFKMQVEYLRSKDPLFSVSTDIIVGFPGETEEQFQDTMKAMKEIVFDFAYIARYSKRPGTYADKNLPDDVSSSEKARRWHILNDLLKEQLKERSELLIGKQEEVLVQGIKEDKYYGRTRNFKEIYFKNSRDVQIGSLVNIKIERFHKWSLEGSLI